MRTTIFKVLTYTAIITWVYACGKDKKTQDLQNIQDTEQPTGSTVDINKTASKSDVIFTDEYITLLYHQYLTIKAGLVNTNNKATRAAAKKMEQGIPEREEYKQLKSVAKLIALTKDVNKQRYFLVTLTEEMEKLMSTATITSGEVYKQFCPMAFDGAGGYWLSDSKEVRNPYFGDKMLKCGTVKSMFK